MKLIRTFHPVGQGAFYSERHIVDGNEFTIVYDCGSSTMTGKKMEKKIKSSFPKNQVIDILFISHFHSDHINGIDTLKKHCQIKKVIIPLLEEKEAEILLKLNNYIHDNNSDTQIFEDTQSYFGDETIIISIAETTDGNEQINDTNLDISGIERSQSVSSGTRIISGITNHNWSFIPFNYKHSERKFELIEVLQNENLLLNDLNTIEKISSHKKAVIKAFKSISGDLNENSMLLFSGNTTDGDYINCNQNSFHWYLDHYYFEHKSGCLYFGDIDLTKTGILVDIKNKFIGLLDYVGTIQIPHHGSIHNFDSSFFVDCNPHCAVISYGTTNQFGHPSDRVIGEISANDVMVHLVSEHQNTLVTQWMN